MSVSSTMQQGFIFLLIIWNSSPFASGHATNHLRFLLGCQAVIPCQHYGGDSKTFKWLYKKDEHSDTSLIFSQEEKGLPFYMPLLRSRIDVLRNRSLVIKNLTEDDEGLYWCEICFRGTCLNKQSTVTSVKKEIPKETNKTFYITAGISFTHACPGELTNIKWTFGASNMTALSDSAHGPESRFVTSNKSIHIVNVRGAEAGKYTCWTSGCDGNWYKLLTINLCIITVSHSEDSSVSCAVMCDMEFNKINPNRTLHVETDTRTVSVDPYWFLNCSIKPLFDGYSTINSTHGPLNALNNATDIPTEPEYVPLIYGTSAALTCLILMTLLICYFKPRLRAACPIHLCCYGSDDRVEEETSVVYSSIVIRRPADTTNNHMTRIECVYSEIKV